LVNTSRRGNRKKEIDGKYILEKNFTQRKSIQEERREAFES